MLNKRNWISPFAKLWGGASSPVVSDSSSPSPVPLRPTQARTPTPPKKTRAAPKVKDAESNEKKPRKTKAPSKSEGDEKPKKTRFTKKKANADAADEDKPKRTRVVKEKKVFEKPGQKKDTPDPEDPLYKFYTSLLKQNGDSKMALKWCMEHGVLSEQKALKAIEKLCE